MTVHLASRLVWLAIGIAAGTAGCARPPEPAAPAPAPVVPVRPRPALPNVPYGDHPKQVLDLYQPRTDGPAPVLFYVHGGAWMTGDKNSPDFLDECLRHGIAVVSIEYRFLTEAAADRVDPPVLAPLDDAVRALQFVRYKAAEWRLDPARIVACGGSAGGFTSLYLAFADDRAEPDSEDPVARQSTRLRGAMVFVPQTSLDPRQMREWVPDIDYGHHAFGLPSFDEFLRRRDELMPVIERISPYALASADDPPVWLYYGTAPAAGAPSADPVHSANFGPPLAARLKELGVACDLAYPGAAGLEYPTGFGFIEARLRQAVAGGSG